MNDYDLIWRGDVLYWFDGTAHVAVQMSYEEARDRIRALPAVQPDAAAIREAALSEAISHARQALVDAAHKYGGINVSKASAMFTAETHVTVALYQLMNNPGKEVMPDERPVRVRQTDIGPGDQAVAGAAFWRDQSGNNRHLGQPEPVARAAPVTVPEAARVLLAAIGKRTSCGEREAHSSVGHRLDEASWHVHLAGFCSQGEAENALRALLAVPASPAQKGDHP
jgi:hypothetical protein